ncbi:DMT family transporter [Pelagibacterium lentulum]|uniref:Drug/metabolite exporter YedA n=1 Tax=Pelagibacterium lentulum TaxID=2029865 RepID=A0A916W2F1_9HYPH|nr:DMT family transporter [Pelagibacterium lentulum]GGA60666.1 drug/metabolite exporter YedA [Pelagibacterium lentulum]
MAHAKAPVANVGVPAPDNLTLAAFLIASIIAGANAVAVRVGLTELAPFWGAGVRFGTAAAILIAAGLLLRRTFPSGRALLGAILYGLLSFGLTYMFLYWALQEATAGTVMVAFAVAPLLTLLLAIVQRLERFTFHGIVGALIAGIGVGIVFADQMRLVSPLTLAAILAGAVAAAQSTIIVKSFPRVDPVVENGVGMAVGSVLLFVASLIAGEPWIVPTTLPVQLSLVYLILVGSIGLFLLFLFILSRWTASATIYVLLLAPLTAVALDLIILGDMPTVLLVIGGIVAVIGVYIGALFRPPAVSDTKRLDA